MLQDKSSRRRFLKEVAAVSSAALAAGRPAAAADPKPRRRVHLSCNQYPWFTFYRREGRDFAGSLDEGLAEVAQSGVDGFEPSLSSPADVDKFAPLLAKHGLRAWSFYVNSTLHEADKVQENIDTVLAVAEKARKQLGTRLVVTNPSPIRWGGPENKDDAQLEVQAAALDKLGARLKAAGLQLAYHNHDIELRNAAREFHHMMLGTDPANVSLCLDAHWIYRGSGNSSVALFDVVKLYGPRVAEVHLRQSHGGVWSETFSPGDIDYPRLARALVSAGMKPLLVLEQCVEKETPNTMGPVEAHQQGRRYAEQVFAAFAG